MAATGWTLRSTTESLGRTYSRPFGLNEYGFYYDCLFNGTADCQQRMRCETKGTQGDDIFGEANVAKAWATVKQRCPLLGSRWEVHDEIDDVRFVVSERLLAEHPAGQITFLAVNTAAEVDDFIRELMNGPQRDFARMPARVFIIRELDRPNVHQVVMQISHVVCDATCLATITRTFLDALVSPPYGVPDLEERLSKVVRAEDLNPARKFSVARQRWRRAIAGVIYRIRDSGIHGGHALPRTLTWDTYHTPPERGFILMQFPADLTARMLENCRRRKYTFGSALAVLSQVASACVFYRRYLRGEYTEEEFDAALRHPMHTRGAISTRPFSEKSWWVTGGLTEVFCCITFFCVTLPFVPRLSKEAMLADMAKGKPIYASLMSADRFALRCHMIRRQFRELMQHPLFLELGDEHVKEVIAHKRRVFQRYRKALVGQDPHDGFTGSGLKEGMLYTSEWTSVGSFDDHVAFDFPVPPTSPAYWRPNVPRVLDAPVLEAPQTDITSSVQEPANPACENDVLLRLIESDGSVKARPADIYLAAMTMHGVMRISLMHDKKVYSTEMITEWTNDIREAAQYFLGQDITPHPKL